LTNVLPLRKLAHMATHVKDVLRAGTFRKGAQSIRVSPEDLNLARLNFEKMKLAGYRVPVIIEHAKPDDPEGLPVRQEQMSARDRAKYQAGWSEDLRLNDKGVLEVAMDVKSKDGLKLVDEIGTYVSPQFGPWTFPGDSKPTPMVITHFALTPYPVDIGQNPEFRAVGSPLNATQLSQLVSFSMADMIPNHSEPDGDEAPDEKPYPEAPEAETPSIEEEMPNPGAAAVQGKINEAFGMLGVIIPQGVDVSKNPEALLSALMTAAHHTNEAKAADAAAQQPQVPVPGQDPTQDPRLNGTKQENTFTMSQTTAPAANSVSKTPVDFKTLPEFVQLSQTVSVLTTENAQLKRTQYNSRIDNLLNSGRIKQEQADKFRATVGTYQFSATQTSTDFVRLDAQLEFAEGQPVGAILSPEERVNQFAMTEHKPGAFFDAVDPTLGLSETEIDALLDQKFGPARK